jgi:hypothetical protein
MKELSKADKLNIIDAVLERSSCLFIGYLCFEIYEAIKNSFDDVDELRDSEKTDFVIKVFPELLQIKPADIPLHGISGWFGVPVVGADARMHALKRLRIIVEAMPEAVRGQDNAK